MPFKGDKLFWIIARFSMYALMNLAVCGLVFQNGMCIGCQILVRCF